jgi:hypothetical protein
MKIIASTLIALSLSLTSRLRQSPLTEPPPGARRAVRPNKSIVGLRCCTIARLAPEEHVLVWSRRTEGGGWSRTGR